MMNSLLFLAPSLAAGLVLGTFFFGGLWLTVFRGISAHQPALWFLGSLLLRMSITLLGFYFVGRENWQRWLLCVLGFLLARLVVTWLTRPRNARSDAQASETLHAP